MAVLFGILWPPAMTVSAEENRSIAEVEITGSGSQARTTLGDLSVHLKTADQISHNTIETVPELSLYVEGKKAARLTGAPASRETVNARARFLELDPTNQHPELVMTTFSGGAHCCTEIQVAASERDGTWTVVDLGSWNGNEAEFIDADESGSLELVEPDNDFLYAFDCYACSVAPLKILSLRNGHAIDVSRNRSFRDYQRRYLRTIERQAGDRGDTFSPGFWAGWIAQKALLGEGQEAFQKMLGAYNPMRDEGYVRCPDGGPDCPVQEEVFQSFPTALKKFLDFRNYPTD